LKTDSQLAIARFPVLDFFQGNATIASLSVNNIQHFMHGKKWLLVAVFFIGGIALMAVGTNSFFNGRKLQREGKTAAATVVDRSARNLYKDSKAYYLTLAFETDTKQKVTQEIMVQYPQFTRTAANATVTIHYLPSDPSVCMIDPIEIRYGQIIGGAVFAALGLLFAVLFVKFPNFGSVRRMTDDEIKEHARPIATEAAGKIVKNMAALCESRHEWTKADPKQFRHIDVAFYDDTRRLLESRGFIYLEDTENVTLRNSANNPNTFVRVMLGGNGTVMAGIYHFKPSTAKRMLGMKEVKVLDFETQFTNGCFVCTNNAEAVSALTQPAEVDNLNLVAATPFPTLLDAHEKRVALFMEKTGVQPVRLENAADVRKAQDALHRLKAEHRQKTGLTKTEIQKLGGGDVGEKEADLLFEEILKEHGKERQKKS
jgi:hypothetical protein